MQEVRLSEISFGITGIYALCFPNGKKYIGQAQDIRFRIREHNQRSRHGRANRDIQVCEKAIKKYGEIDYFLILEECPLSDLDNKEKYWIKYYKSNNKEYGYNILEGGDVSNKRGFSHPNSIFSPKEIEEIYDLLQNHKEKSQKEIAELYNVCEDTICRINLGYAYKNENISYPVRKEKSTEYQKKTFDDYFSNINEVLSLKRDLQESWWLDIENDLYKKYNIPLSLIRDINNGRKYVEMGNFDNYPLRDRNFVPKNSSKITYEKVEEIVNMLEKKILSMTDISKKTGISRKIISSINKGIRYRLPNKKYPIR